MDIRSLPTHQERKDARKAQRTAIKTVLAQPYVRPSNKKKDKSSRRVRNPSEGIYTPSRSSLPKATRLQLKAFQKAQIEYNRHVQVLKGVQNDLEMKQDEFLKYCEDKLEQEEFEFVLKHLNAQEWFEKFGPKPETKEGEE